MPPDSQVFPKSARLLKAADFKRVFDRAGKSADALFTVLARDNGIGEARLGLVVAKKHARHAVQRNRIKRMIRESFRQHRAQMPSLDFVVLIRPGTQRASNEQLSAALTQHWQRIARRVAHDDT